MRRLLRAAALGPAALLLCAAGALAQPAQQPEAEPAIQAQASDYEIGAQDVLRITVYGHQDLSQVVLVQTDGTFTFPLIGTVKCDGMTTQQLAQKLTTLLANGYVRNPQVTVVVQEFRSKSVFVVGEVARPGSYPVPGKLNLVEVLARAGPMTANASAEIIVVRPPAGSDVQGPVLPSELSDGAAETEDDAPAEDATRPQVIRVNVRELQAGGLDKNIELRPNDTVFVPVAPKVFVSGEVKSPGAYAWFPGMTARQLISVAGGLTPEGSDGRLKVVRDQDGKPRERGIKLDEAVQAGDSLVVRRRLF